MGLTTLALSAALCFEIRLSKPIARIDSHINYDNLLRDARFTIGFYLIALSLMSRTEKPLFMAFCGD
jgi:hypothetical protein